MRYITPIIEQLDRATLEFRTDHSISNRLALILIDNALELVLHRRCADAVLHDRYFPRDLKKLSLKQRKAAVGRAFDGKLGVVVDLGDISEAERRFITICHDYRNELYHVGLQHDDVIRAIAGEYYKLCVGLFVRLKPDVFMVSSSDTMGNISRKYLGDSLFGVGFDLFQSAGDKLLDALPAVPDLSESLATAADDSIEKVRQSFEFVVDDNFDGSAASEVLRQAQFHFDFLTELEKEGIDGVYYDPDTAPRVSEVKKTLQKIWRPRFRKLPISPWLERSAKVGKQRDPLVALDRYQALRNDMQYLEDVISDAAAALDAAIQQQIDMARGK